MKALLFFVALSLLKFSSAENATTQQSTEVGQSKKLLAIFCQTYCLIMHNLKLFKSKKKLEFKDLIGSKIDLTDFEIIFF